MSDSEVKSLIEKVSELQDNVHSVITALNGDEKFKVRGLRQDVDDIKTDLKTVQFEVRKIKSDKRWVLGWIAGASAVIAAIWTIYQTIM